MVNLTAVLRQLQVRMKLIALLMLCGLATAQTASLDECRTKGDLWLHEGVSGIHKLPVAELYSRDQLMEQCAKSYPQTSSHIREWEMFGRIYREEIGVRAMSFITRHNLKNKFLEEDAEGTR
jgi:hypothetical protein